MGLFDKFRKKVREAASEVDSDSLSAEEGSEEAIEALSHQEQLVQAESQHNSDVVPSIRDPSLILEKMMTIGKILMKKKNYNYPRLKTMSGMIGMTKKNILFQPN